MSSNTLTNGNPKKWFNISNVLTFAMLIFIFAMFINPNIKAFVIQKLMSVGLFQPSIPVETSGNDEIIAPEKIAFKDSNGTVISFSDLRGKVVFLNFWATWCLPCIAEMPSINSLKQKYQNNDKVVFLLVDADGDF